VPVARGAATGAERWRLDTVVLDAGHGGHDHGGVGNGTSDKEVAIGVVSRLGPMLERELGVRVVYTRRNDTFVELRERGRIANREGGKLFISVHANSARSSSARGTETFFLAPSKSAVARDVMERENSVIELESAPDLYESFDDESDILQSLAMSAYQEESQALATLIEREFVASGRQSRGVKQGPFIVLWAASMPAVLVEAGFVSNPEEARYISSDAGLDATARAIFNAVRTYKEQYERALRAAR
jgi:N-acetylmuramoyl-L-alanine amidase